MTTLAEPATGKAGRLSVTGGTIYIMILGAVGVNDQQVTQLTLRNANQDQTLVLSPGDPALTRSFDHSSVEAGRAPGIRAKVQAIELLGRSQADVRT